MGAPDAQGAWLPLLDFAIRNGVSLSTLRRHIKSKKVTYRVENGRYLLLDDGKSALAPSASLSMDELRRELRAANEEIAELKTLIAFYEESAGRPGKTRLDV